MQLANGTEELITPLERERGGDREWGERWRE
jgi:hypothetical protein